MNIKSLSSYTFCLLIFGATIWSPPKATGFTSCLEEKGELRTNLAIQEEDAKEKDVKEEKSQEEESTTKQEKPDDSKNAETENAETKNADTENAETADGIVIELPENPEAVVLTFDSESIRPMREGDFKPTTLFQMFADGRVLIGRNDPRATELEYTMTKEEMHQLVDEIVNKNTVFEISTDGIKKKMKDTGRPFHLMDAPIHRISVNLADKKHEVQVDGLVSTRRFYKEIEQLQTFAKIHDKFVFLRARAALGPQAKVDRLMRDIAKEFKKQYPDDEPIKLEDIEWAFVNDKDRLFAHFARVDYENDRPKYAYSCAVEKGKGKKPSITIMRARLG